MSVKDKYRPRFAKQLAAGMRLSGKTIVQCCLEWKVTRGSYYYWIDNNPKFAKAAELGEMHFQSWLWEKYKKALDGEEKINAGLMTLAAKNYLGMTDRVEVDHHHDEQITTIKIEYLPQNNIKVIEHERTQDLLDEKPG